MTEKWKGRLYEPVTHSIDTITKYCRVGQITFYNRGEFDPDMAIFLDYNTIKRPGHPWNINMGFDSDKPDSSGDHWVASADIDGTIDLVNKGGFRQATLSLKDLDNDVRLSQIDLWIWKPGLTDDLDRLYWPFLRIARYAERFFSGSDIILKPHDPEEEIVKISYRRDRGGQYWTVGYCEDLSGWDSVPVAQGDQIFARMADVYSIDVINTENDSSLEWKIIPTDYDVIRIQFYQPEVD